MGLSVTILKRLSEIGLKSVLLFNHYSLIKCDPRKNYACFIDLTRKMCLHFKTFFVNRDFFKGTLIANLCKFLVQISFYSRPLRQTTMTVAAKVAVQVLEINENKPIENVADIFARRLRTLKKRLVIILFTSLSVLIIFYPSLDENRKK